MIIRLILSALFLLLTISIYSCHEKKSAISEIQIATGYCHGECPLTAAKIDSSLKIEFYGGDYSGKHGYYKGFIKKSDWAEITALLENINYASLYTVYQKTLDDQAIELIVEKDGHLKHIRGQDGSLPKSVSSAFLTIADIYKKADIKLVKDTILFDTKIQYTPKIGKPKFLPTVKDD